MIENNKKLLTWIGISIFVLGAITASIYQGLLLWGHLEDTQFDTSDPALMVEERLRTLQCPRIITLDEVTTVSAAFTNPTDSSRIRIVRTNISEGFVSLRRELITNLTLSPGETQRLEWEVSSDDAVWGRFIFVRVHVLRTSAQLPAQSATCNILVLNLSGVSGSLIANLWLALSLLGPVLGVGMWSRPRWPLIEDDKKRFFKMGLIVLFLWAGLYFSMAGYWILHLVVLVFLIFILLGMMTSFIVSSPELM
ncbi:MAG: hypothetical protein R6X32_09290 [Chloroflexota bacterium]